MKRLFLLFLVALVWPVCVVADNEVPEEAKTQKAVIPVFSQKISFRLPKDWKPAHEDYQGGFYLIEFIPETEVIDNWSNLLTIQGFENLAGKTSPAHFLDNLAARFQKVCAEHMVYEKLGPLTVTNHPAFAAIIGCTNIPDPRGNSQQAQSEIGYYISIKGINDHYLIHKSIRDKAFDKNASPLNKNNAAEFIRDFMPFELCKGGGEPYECSK